MKASFILIMPSVRGPTTLTDEQTEQIIEKLNERFDLAVQAISQEYEVALDYEN